MTGSRIFHTLRRLFVIPFVFSFSLRSQRPSCRGIAVEPASFSCRVIAAGRGGCFRRLHPRLSPVVLCSGSRRRISMFRAAVLRFVGPCRRVPARRGIGSRACIGPYSPRIPVRGIGTPCGASAVLPSSRPPTAALPCSRSSPCAAPRPFPSLSGRCLSERDCRRAERPLWA